MQSATTATVYHFSQEKKDVYWPFKREKRGKEKERKKERKKRREREREREGGIEEQLLQQLVSTPN